LDLSRLISKRITQGEPGSFGKTIHKVAIISISIGMTSLLIAFAVLGGFQNKIKEKVYAFSGHLLISKYSRSTSYEDTDIRVNAELRGVLDELPYVEKWQSYAYKAGLLKTNEEVQGVIFKGVDDGFDTAYFRHHMTSGKFPEVGSSESDQQNYSTEIALSQYMSRFLKLGLGDEVMIFFVQNPPRYRKLKVVGIYETGLEEFDQRLILGDLKLIRRINNWSNNQASGVEVFLSDDMDLYEAQQDIFNRTDIDLYVENVNDRYLQIFDWLHLLNRNVLIFLILILTVACFSMVSVLLILIMERTQMVGILKAMGADNRMIRHVFIRMGWNLVFRGLLLGNGVGLVICALQYYFRLLPLDPVNYYMSYVPIYFDWTAIFGVNILFVGLIAASLLIPVTIVSRIRPIQAIRFD
jgi:lipoprotein-releasing system permease protein